MSAALTAISSSSLDTCLERVRVEAARSQPGAIPPSNSTGRIFELSDDTAQDSAEASFDISPMMTTGPPRTIGVGRRKLKTERYAAIPVGVFPSPGGRLPTAQAVLLFRALPNPGGGRGT